MTDRGKTIICSVLFLDIVEYSRKSVSGQISLKERFNAYLSVAIRDVPIDDRIILDTGDGAALSFLGDVGDALQVALSMRESLREGLHMEPSLLVRMGVNLGPVRLIRDINGQPNIVGDGINVAQRVMGFADPGQILVSRTYYDAVSRLSPEYAGMFHYQGSRTDKHVREHEIYAIGYPGEFTSTLTLSGEGGRSGGELADLSRKIGKSWRSALAAFSEASLAMRAVYVGGALVLLAALITAMVAVIRHPGPPAPPSVTVSPGGAVVPASAVTAIPESGVSVSPSGLSERERLSRSTREKAAREAAREQAARTAREKERAKQKAQATQSVIQRLLPGSSRARVAGQALLTVTCPSGATVYVDGQYKGTLGKRGTLRVPVDAGKHLVLIMYSSRVYSKSLDFSPGRAIGIRPNICR